MAAGDGLVSMTPTSIAHSGTSASINADGGVDFTAVTELSLDGVFTSDYDNYLMVITGTMASGNDPYRVKFRASGADTTGSDYTFQRLRANPSENATRFTSQSDAWVGQAGDANNTGTTVAIYGPALAQPTAMRNVHGGGADGTSIYDFASTHSLSTAYDGLTLYVTSSTITGNIHVFGYEE